MNKGLLAVVIGGVGYGLYRIAQNAGRLQFGAAKLQKTTYSPLVNFDFHLILPIKNPTDTQYPIQAIEGAAFYGDTKIANFEMESQNILLATGQTVNVPLVVKVNILTLASDVQKLIKDGNWLNKATLKGVVKSTVNFPFEEKIF